MLAKRLLAAAVLFLSVGDAWGTSMIRLSLQQMCLASAYVVRARVANQQYEWNSAHTGIVTLTQVEVEEALKGHPPSALVIEQMGGRMGNLRVQAPGGAHFLAGDDYFLFIQAQARRPGRFLVVGMMQGAYRIFRDARTGDERVIRPAAQEFAAGAAQGVQPSLEAAPKVAVFRRLLWQAMSAPVVIPPLTQLPVVLDSVSTPGRQQRLVSGHLARDVFPSAVTVLPQGTVLNGVEKPMGQMAVIRWDRLVINGENCSFNGASRLALSQLKPGAPVVATAMAGNHAGR